MSKVMKALIRGELEARLRGVDGGVFINAQGLNSEKTYAFRKALHAGGVQYTVLRNALAREAFRSYGYDVKALGRVLEGPCGVLYTTSENSAATAARALTAWKKEAKDKTVVVKGAFIDGAVLGPQDAEALKDAPTKDQARAMLLGVLQAPITRLLATLWEPEARIVYLLHAYYEKREEQGEQG